MAPKSYQTQSGGFLSAFLLLAVLVISISNYLSFNRLEIHLASQPIEIPGNSLQMYQDAPSRDLRKMALQNAETDRTELLKASTESNNQDFYKKIKIEAHCPIKERIGESGDGGKFVCNPIAAKKDCTLISLGLNNQIGYDRQIFNATGRKCKSLGADREKQNENTQKEYAEINGQLFAGKLPEELTIAQMLEKSGRSDVELLKIDIEGGEFTSLEPLISNYFVCQIFIEIHGKPAEHLKMMQTIAKYGFRVFSTEPNPYCDTCCEYSYINEMCMHQFGVIPLAITVPVPV